MTLTSVFRFLNRIGQTDKLITQTCRFTSTGFCITRFSKDKTIRFVCFSQIYCIMKYTDLFEIMQKSD